MLNDVRRRSPGGNRISFLPLAREITVPTGASVVAAAAEAGLTLDSPCERGGLCGACKLRFIEGAPEPSPWDRLHFDPRELEEGWRLACRADVPSDALVSVPRQAPYLRLEDHSYPYRLSPPAQRARVRASASTVPPDARGLLPTAALGEQPRELTLEVVGDQVRDIRLGWRECDRLGVAVCVQGDQIGGWLLDLNSGEQLSAATGRLIGGSEPAEGGAESISAATRRLVRSLCVQARKGSDLVSDIVVLGGSGEEAVDSEGRPLRAVGQGNEALSNLAAASAVAACPPGCGTTVLLSLDPYPWAMYLEGDEAWLTGTPMPGLGIGELVRPDAPGAVRHISLAPEVELGYESGPPTGLSLSAAVDGVAELWRAGLINHRGALLRRDSAPSSLTPEIRERLAGPEDEAVFRLWGAEGNGALNLRQGHVRFVQRLKALLACAWESVLEQAGVETEHLDRVVLVGEAAASLRVRSAVAVGLLPPVSTAIVQVQGPAAGMGARLALLSTQAGKDIARLSRECRRVPVPDVSKPGWAERLYLGTPASGRGLDAQEGALLDFRSRGSVGIGRRA
ncbi:MAG: ASKHA domain-containing protein [Chloroflexota bacterium]|nr:ASKHA domain-containing protein [Chloroflexota bacterium]